MKRGADPRGTNQADRASFVRCYPVLKELPSDLLRKVEDRARLVEAPAGRRLFDEGSPCADYPLLVEGIIRASKFGPDGHEILLYRLNPGESCVITVIALLGGTAYPAVGTAETRLTLFAIPRDLFVELVLKTEAFRTFVFQSLSQRMARLMALIDDVAFRRVDQRLASRLLRHREPIILSGITELEVSGDEVRRIASIDAQLADQNPHVAVVIVAPRNSAFGIARMWEVYVVDTGWQTGVFRTLSDAEAWLSARRQRSV